MSDECVRDCHGSIDNCGHCRFLRAELAEFVRMMDTLKAENERLRAALGSVWAHHGKTAPGGCQTCDRRIDAALAKPDDDSGDRIFAALGNSPEFIPRPSDA